MKSTVIHDVNLDRDEVSSSYDDGHKFQAFVKGTWTPVHVSVFRHRFGGYANLVAMNDMIVCNARGSRKETFVSERVARVVGSLFRNALEVRCMQ